MELGYRLVDADNHYYETPDCFSRHIEARYRDKAITANKQSDGSWKVLVGDKPYNFMHVKFDKTNPPGSMHALLHQKDSDAGISWGDSYSAENMLAGFQHRDARIELLEQQNVDAAIMLPTFAVSVEDYMVDDVEQTYANLRSFNRWIQDQWGFDYDGRIFSPAMLSLVNRDEAITELDRVMAEGARLVHLRPCPYGEGNRSIADPYFDPFWARINEAGLPVAFHIADFRYPELAVKMGDDPRANVREMSAFQWAFLHGDRPIIETLGALLFGNMHNRFPNLRYLSIENGSDWVYYLMTLLDKKKNMARFGPWIGGRPSGKLSQVFKQVVYVSPYPEDDVDALIRHIGASQVLFGSDYPHPEGLVEPVDFVDLIPSCDAAQTQAVMRTNTAALLGL
ncbi:MAG: amidohydrolase family protein [Acidimicrobiia bacterium]